MIHDIFTIKAWGICIQSNLFSEKERMALFVHVNENTQLCKSVTSADVKYMVA